MFPKSFFSKSIQLAGRGVSLDVAIPKPRANLRHFSVRELFDCSLNFLHGAHV